MLLLIAGLGKVMVLRYYQQPNSEKLGSCVKMKIKTECSDLEISHTHVLFATEHRKHVLN